MGTIFVGNRLTMEGKHIEVPSEISFLKSPIEEAVYNSFENVFTTVKHRNFLKAMKMNNILFEFIEYHIRKFFEICKNEIENQSKDSIDKQLIQQFAQDYFNKSINSYKNKLLSVSF